VSVAIRSGQSVQRDARLTRLDYVRNFPRNKEE